MGEERVKVPENKEQSQKFLKYLLRDVRAMGKMLEEGWFEIDNIRIGAEQELCLIDENAKPAPIAMELLEEINDDSFTTELAKFNLEANLEPLLFEGKCLSQMERTFKRNWKLLGKV